MAREDLIEFVDDAVSWMVAAKKSHPSLLLPAWVAQWQENRPTPLAPDRLAVGGLGDNPLQSSEKAEVPSAKHGGR